MGRFIVKLFLEKYHCLLVVFDFLLEMVGVKDTCGTCKWIVHKVKSFCQGGFIVSCYILEELFFLWLGLVTVPAVPLFIVFKLVIESVGQSNVTFEMCLFVHLVAALVECMLCVW